MNTNKRMTAYDGEGLEVGCLTLAEANERYRDVRVERGTITVGALRPDYVDRSLAEYASQLVDSGRAVDLAAALRLMRQDARAVAMGIPGMRAPAVAAWCDTHPTARASFAYGVALADRSLLAAPPPRKLAEAALDGYR